MTSESKKVYLRDFVPSWPIPSGFQIPEEELYSYLANDLKVSYRRFDGVTYINYPIFFGASFENVWFSTKVISVLENHHLYELEKFIQDEDDERSLLDIFPDAEIFVQRLTYPLNMFPMKGGSIGIT